MTPHARAEALAAIAVLAYLAAAWGIAAAAGYPPQGAGTLVAGAVVFGGAVYAGERWL